MTDKLSIDWRICECMLFVNAIWDFLSAGSIWYTFGNRHSKEDNQGEILLASEEQPNSNEGGEDKKTSTNMVLERKKEYHKIIQHVAGMHTDLWISQEIANNYGACMLMGWWIFTLGMIRLSACFREENISNAALTYAVEGIFFLVESMKGTTTPKKSFYISVLSFVCMLICAIKIPESYTLC